MEYSKKNIQLLDPYKPGFQPEPGTKFIKLNTNENAYPPSEKVYKEFTLYAFGRNINKYHRFNHGEIEKFEGKKEENIA